MTDLEGLQLHAFEDLRKRMDREFEERSSAPFVGLDHHQTPETDPETDPVKTPAPSAAVNPHDGMAARFAKMRREAREADASRMRALVGTLERWHRLSGSKTGVKQLRRELWGQLVIMRKLVEAAETD